MLHASTLTARSPAQLHAHLRNLAPYLRTQTLLFALSTNAPDLPDLVSALTTYANTSVGCLAAPAPEISNSDRFSCALGFFENETTTPFRSTIPGRPPAQVGRWHSFRKGEDVPDKSVDMGLKDTNIDWEDVWARSTGEPELPTELEKLNPSEVHTVLHLSDREPEGLSHSLQRFKSANKLGLIASSTPFITGRPVTLFQNDRIYSGGAVGLALTSEPAPQINSIFPGLVAITERFTVTNAEGNLVHEVDGRNPSKILLNAISKLGTLQDNHHDYYLGVFADASPSSPLVEAYHVTSGDPSRGTMALETEAAPAVGSSVQLFRRPQDSSPAPLAVNDATEPWLSFVSAEADALHVPAKEGVGEEAEAGFIAFSENGFLLSRNEGATWRCTVPGARATLSF